MSCSASKTHVKNSEGYLSHGVSARLRSQNCNALVLLHCLSVGIQRKYACGELGKSIYSTDAHLANAY